MVLKKEKQILARERHLQQLNAAKLRRSQEPELIRQRPFLFVKPTILIVCEGENTEPSYFKQFRLASAKIEAFGKGYNTLSLIKWADGLRKLGNYDQVWCVFDKDSNLVSKFNRAISAGESLGFKIAYSNQAFEYWLILHFEDHQGGHMDRSQYSATLNKYINPLGAFFDGDGDKLVTKELFNILMGFEGKTSKSRTDLAIKRAKRNFALFNHQSPGKEESSTNVFELVDVILKYI